MWTAMGALALFGFGAPAWLWIVFAAAVVLFGIPPIRKIILTAPIVGFLKAKAFLPAISETERTAIEAGNVWVDGELFSGKPDFKRILNEAYPDLSEEEQLFMDGPVEEACRMTNDWEVFKNKDLSPEVWDFIRKERFFGLLIPKKYGGHEFSPSLNSAVVAKLMGRCGTLAITVMVPNSLGPGELIMHYGTQEQKDYYLPKLARGEEIPAFALTEPGAGSDAGAMTSRGIIFKDEKEKLYIRINWRKRYITLAAISTVLGLAFKLYDPENHLGKGENLGITCALVPTSTTGVVLGQRHDPLGIPFYNCPTEGHDVVVPIEAIIGGPEQAGNGWRMLMESLAVGRGISLPASGVGGVKLATRVVGAYAKIRQQFGLSIGKFEGIEEPLARIGGYNYILEAARRFTCGGLDTGQKPPVVTAIAKYNFTETLRKAINDAMDVLGGAGISRGPRNLLANGYMGVPINITVEGANILTRTLMIFGQGAIRCHPYAYKEITALMNGNISDFDRSLWKHVGHVICNLFRSVLLSLTRGHLSRSPVSGPAAKYYRKISWASASFALLSDVAMGIYGGNLKRKEKLTGRFADVFSWLYLGISVLRRFEAEGQRKEDLPFFQWSMQYSLAQIQEAFEGILQNMPFPFRGLLAFWRRVNRLETLPSDKLGSKVAQLLQIPGEQRDRFTINTHIPKDKTEALGRLENAFQLVSDAEPILKKIYGAVKSKQLKKDTIEKLVKAAVKEKIITQEEATLLAKAEEARMDTIQVDSFTLAEYMNGKAEKAVDGKKEKKDTFMIS
ncbi:MAG: acyl-CoA dehydrogenase [Gammaproteobacteria bacterium SG8_11]|nr:MAG: acyl-CoA dehydrogenase [Gammaproteobacteria bacterium SG8_11]